MRRILGGALCAGGVVLFVVGMNAKDSMADQWSNFFTGKFTDTTVWYLIVGAVAAVGGLMMLISNGRRVAI